MAEFENAVRLASDYGLGIVLSVFLAFSFVVLGKKLISGNQRHEDHLVEIIREKEDGLVDHVSNLTMRVQGLASRSQQMSEQIDHMQGKINEIKESQDDIRDMFEG